MGDDIPDLEQKLQKWSIWGANIPWATFTISILILLIVAAIEDPNPSQFDYGISVSLLLLLAVGIVDQFRTSMYFRSFGIILLALYGANSLFNSSAVSWIMIGGCFFVISLLLVLRKIPTDSTTYQLNYRKE